jgi:hypothetical protein
MVSQREEEEKNRKQINIPELPLLPIFQRSSEKKMF